jgi:hypothetical protein
VKPDTVPESSKGIPILLVSSSTTHIGWHAQRLALRKPDLTQLRTNELGGPEIYDICTKRNRGHEWRIVINTWLHLTDNPSPNFDCQRGMQAVRRNRSTGAVGCIAASSRWISSIGIDPSSEGFRAARRVSRATWVDAPDALYLVADGSIRSLSRLGDGRGFS